MKPYPVNPKWRRTRLYEKLIDRGLTMRQVESETGVVRSRLSEYERALAEPRVTVAIKLAKFFGMTVEELFS